MTQKELIVIEKEGHVYSRPNMKEMKKILEHEEEVDYKRFLTYYQLRKIAEVF